MSANSEYCVFDQNNRKLFSACGVPNKIKRIVGGEEAEVLAYPWLAVMMYGGRFYCGAALISGNF